MTEEQQAHERTRFHLMDLENNGYITWNEFLDFEASELLSKKNKVELSNALTMKELLRAKKEFLSYDKDKVEMISQEDAKECYISYIEKLRYFFHFQQLFCDFGKKKCYFSLFFKVKNWDLHLMNTLKTAMTCSAWQFMKTKKKGKLNLGLNRLVLLYII